MKEQVNLGKTTFFYLFDISFVLTAHFKIFFFFFCICGKYYKHSRCLEGCSDFKLKGMLFVNISIKLITDPILLFSTVFRLQRHIYN